MSSESETSGLGSSVQSPSTSSDSGFSVEAGPSSAQELRKRKPKIIKLEVIAEKTPRQRRSTQGRPPRRCASFSSPKPSPKTPVQTKRTSMTGAKAKTTTPKSSTGGKKKKNAMPLDLETAKNDKWTNDMVRFVNLIRRTAPSRTFTEAYNRTTRASV